MTIDESLQPKVKVKFSDRMLAVPDKQFFIIGEVASLCNIKTHVLRYWEQVFPQLKPLKRKGNRRYYSRENVMLVRKICRLLYDEGFTINGAREKLNTNQRVTNEPIQSSGSSSNVDFDGLIAQLNDVLTILK